MGVAADRRYNELADVSKPEDRQDITIADLAGASGELLPLQKLAGRYVLLGLIGVGGMGSVYRARDEELDEIVALKVLRRELVDAPGVLARFRQEVKLARRVTHRNIARTYDIGEHQGEKFITMEFVDGEPLSDLLARTRGLPVARAVDIGAAICTGLIAAHHAGVVHRDLKPDNVLIAKDGRVVITDFGIARGVAAAGAAVATQGLPVGTPAYMAPEQVEGGAVDARADIYAFGEILYELLTGERAWKGDSVYQVAAARLISPPPDPRTVRPDLPTSLATLVLRCMARKKEDRFENAALVMQVLTSLTLPALAFEVAAPSASVVLSSRRPTVEAPTPAKSLAVLVFRNAGPPEDEYLADGLTEDLIDTLSMSDRVRVRALGAVLQLKGREGDPRKIGRDLDVQVVVEGSVKRLGETLRINARLISVADGFQLWAKRFDRPVADFLKVGDEMADAVAGALAVDRKGGARATVADPVALDLYLRGRHEFHRGWSEATKRALDLFSQALARVPNDPVILSAYAMAQLRIFSYGVEPEVGATIARQAAEHARTVAPNLPEPHLALATIALAVGDQEGAARELRRVFELGSGLADAHDLFGRLLVEAGRPEEGLRSMEKAFALEPRLGTSRSDVGRIYELIGQRDRCEAIFAIAPTDPASANSFWLNRARVIMWRRDVGAAKACMSGGAGLPVGPGVHFLKVLIHGTLDAGAAADFETRIQGGASARRRTCFFNQVKAEFRLTLGDEDGAMEALEAADAALLFDVLWLDRCPLLDPLRSRPAFVRVRAATEARAMKIRDILLAPSPAKFGGP